MKTIYSFNLYPLTIAQLHSLTIQVHRLRNIGDYRINFVMDEDDKIYAEVGLDNEKGSIIEVWLFSIDEIVATLKLK